MSLRSASAYSARDGGADAAVVEAPAAGLRCRLAIRGQVAIPAVLVGAAMRRRSGSALCLPGSSGCARDVLASGRENGRNTGLLYGFCAIASARKASTNAARFFRLFSISASGQTELMATTTLS